MSTVELARRRHQWEARFARWRAKAGWVVTALKRLPRSIVAVVMLLLGSAVGATGPFLLQQYARAGAVAQEREELLDSLVAQSMTTESTVRQYAQALEVYGTHIRETAMREFSARENVRQNLMTQAEGDKELDRIVADTKEAKARFEEGRRKHDEQIDSFAAWQVNTLLRYKRHFPNSASQAEATFREASSSIEMYRKRASDRAVAHDVVAFVYQDRLRAALLDRRAGKISDEEYQERIAESGKIKIGAQTERLTIDLAGLRRLVETERASSAHK
jgi:hypothetical protein